VGAALACSAVASTKAATRQRCMRAEIRIIERLPTEPGAVVALAAVA
jgi:hypothetical protein